MDFKEKIYYKDVARKAGAPRVWKAAGIRHSKKYNNKEREEKIKKLKRERWDLF